MATQLASAGWIERGSLPRSQSAPGRSGESLEQLRDNPAALQHASVASESCRLAISVDFVAKPNFAQHVRALIPSAINNTFAGLEGFAGCALMVSEQEERLITLLAFWNGRRDSASLAQNARWVRKLLEPYMDHQLRVRTLRAQLAMVPAAPPEESASRESPVAVRRAQLA